MATVQTIEKFFANNAVKMYDFDPGNATPNDIAWVDMRDYEGFAVAFMRTVGTGALDTFSIIANTASDGGGTDATIIAHAIGSEPNALADQIFLECTAEQVAAAGADYRYVSVSAEFATDSDEGVILYVRTDPKHSQSGLTADIVA